MTIFNFKKEIYCKKCDITRPMIKDFDANRLLWTFKEYLNQDIEWNANERTARLEELARRQKNDQNKHKCWYMQQAAKAFVDIVIDIDYSYENEIKSKLERYSNKKYYILYLIGLFFRKIIFPNWKWWIGLIISIVTILITI